LDGGCRADADYLAFSAWFVVLGPRLEYAVLKRVILKASSSSPAWNIFFACGGL